MLFMLEHRFGALKIRLHSSLLVCIVAMPLAFGVLGYGSQLAIESLLLALATVASIFIHELAHVLVGRIWAATSSEITLYPFGGITKLGRELDARSEEWLVAAAGPAASFGIAIGLFLVCKANGETLIASVTGIGASSVLGKAFWINFAIGTVNALPAFPMDGAKILRGIIAAKSSRYDASKLVCFLSYVVAGIMVFLGSSVHGAFYLLAGFVVYGTWCESMDASARSCIDRLRVLNIMEKRFRSVKPSQLLSEIGGDLLTDPQKDYPVIDRRGKWLGVVTRQDLIHSLKGGNSQACVKDVMSKPVVWLNKRDKLSACRGILSKTPLCSFPVVDAGVVVGVVSRQELRGGLLLSDAQNAAVLHSRYRFI